MCIEVVFKPGPAYTPVPLIKTGVRMVALSFDLTKPEDQTKPFTEKVTKYGKAIKIVPKGGVGGSAYATGFALSKKWGPTVSKAKGSHPNHGVHAHHDNSVHNYAHYDRRSVRRPGASD